MNPALVTGRGSEVRMPLHRWLEEPDATEWRILERVAGPALDIGCGPGRHVVALSKAGVLALGVDVSAAAVALARRRGAQVLHRSIFDRLPGEGRWTSALLLDGNIGIGGDPVGLLDRTRDLLAAGGRAFVEAEGPAVPSRRVTARIVNGDEVSEPFPWAHVSVGDLGAMAARSGLVIETAWSEAGRHFGVLLKR